MPAVDVGMEIFPLIICIPGLNVSENPVGKSDGPSVLDKGCT